LTKKDKIIKKQNDTKIKEETEKLKKNIRTKEK